MLRPVANPFPLSIGALYGFSWAAAAIAIVLGLVVTTATGQALGFWALCASVFLFGLPHGAADWWIMGRTADGTADRAAQTKAATVYTLTSLAALAGWWWQPGWSLAGFLALTAWHFGSADASVLLPARRTFRDAVWWMFALGRGLLVVFTGLAFRPAEAVGVLLPFATLGPSVPVALDALVRAALPLTWLGATLQVAAARLDLGSHPGPTDRSRFTANIVETAGLLMLFRVAPPLLSFVAYWVGFHAWRHILRLEWATSIRSLGRTLWDFHRRTLSVTLVSLLGLGLILSIWPKLATGSHAVVVYLIFLSVLTVPHAVVVGWRLDGARMKDEG